LLCDGGLIVTKSGMRLLVGTGDYGAEKTAFNLAFESRI